jgi:transcriptional regulator with XRE-family HTH domain
MQEEQIAKNIKTIRLQKGITLQELEKRSGLTKGYLSRIERSKKSPPYSTINRIAVALGTDVTFLLTENTEKLQDMRLSITKKNKGKIVETLGAFYGYKYEALAHDKPGKNMEAYIIEPAFDEKGIFQHEGEEFIYVLEGEHEFIYDGKKYAMEKGDSVYFDAIVPHTGKSLGKKKAKLLAIMYNYKRL